MARLHWTKELRNLVTERTREDVGPLPQLGRAWAQIRKGWRPAANGFNAFAHRFDTARKHSSADLVEIIDRARAFVTSETMPETAPDAEAAGYALATYWMYPGAGMLFDVIASYGAPLAHAAVLFAHGLKATNRANNYSIQYFVREPRDGSIWARELRRAILRADDAARADCLAAAKESFPNADFYLKVTLAVAYPSQRDWAKEVANAILANAALKYPPVAFVCMSLRELELVGPLLARRSYAQSYLDLVETFGDAVLPMLLHTLEEPRDRGDLRHAAAAVSAFESEEVAATLAKLIGKKDVREVAIPYFLRFPAIGRAALEEAAKKKTKAARLAAQVLAQVERVQAVEAVPSEVVPEDEATPEELPWILTAPPWMTPRRRKKEKEKASDALDLDLLARPESIDLPREERNRLLTFVNEATTPPMAQADADAWQAALERGDAVGLWVHEGKLVPIDRAAAAFNEGRTNLATNVDVDPWVALARVGLPALPAFVRYLGGRFNKSGARYWMTAIHGVDSARVAAALVPHLHGPHADLVRKWMGEHIDSAIVALVQAAVGPGRQANFAATKLRTLAPQHADRIRSVAAEYGADAAKATEAILDRDPRLDCPPKPPTMPSTWRPESLHRPRLKSGRALPLAALEPIGHMLKFTDLAAPYVGLRDIVDACEPRSLAEFSWSLAEGWELSGAKNRDLWMLESLAHFADDEVTRRTTPALKNPHILVVLGVIGTDAAAMELATIVARASSPYLADRAEQQLARIAKTRGITKDELEDRITPTVGLDPDGGTTLDYGPRTLRVGFDSRLEPYVVWDSGERMRQLPPKRRSDDKAKVAEAQAKWRDLKEDVATIADRRSRAVERSMVSGRSWSKAQFLECWVEHPLLFHMAQGILWGILQNGALANTFRVAEDHTFAGENDESVEIPDDARVVVPHRVEMERASERWLRVFEDYRIVQPIDQVARSVHRVDPAEENAAKLERPLPMTMTYYQLDQALGRVGFTDRAWGGNLRTAKMPLVRSNAIAQVEFPYNVTQITTASARFLRQSGEPLTPGDIHPVELSEVIRAILAVTL